MGCKGKTDPMLIVCKVLKMHHSFMLTPSNSFREVVSLFWDYSQWKICNLCSFSYGRSCQQNQPFIKVGQICHLDHHDWNSLATARCTILISTECQNMKSVIWGAVYWHKSVWHILKVYLCFLISSCILLIYIFKHWPSSRCFISPPLFVLSILLHFCKLTAFFFLMFFNSCFVAYRCTAQHRLQFVRIIFKHVWLVSQTPITTNIELHNIW